MNTYIVNFSIENQFVHPKSDSWRKRIDYLCFRQLPDWGIQRESMNRLGK